MTTAHAAFFAPFKELVTFCNNKMPAITITDSSAISITDGIKNCLFPQKLPRITAYTADNASPMSKIRNTENPLASEKRKGILLPNAASKRAKGKVKTGKRQALRRRRGVLLADLLPLLLWKSYGKR